MTRLEDIPLQVLVEELDGRMGRLVSAYCEGLVTEREVIGSYPAKDEKAISLVLRWAKEVRAGRTTWDRLEEVVTSRLAHFDSVDPS